MSQVCDAKTATGQCTQFVVWSGVSRRNSGADLNLCYYHTKVYKGLLRPVMGATIEGLFYHGTFKQYGGSASSSTRASQFI